MSFLENLPPIENLQDPEFAFLVTELFNPLDAVNKEDLGPFPNVTSKRRDIISRFIKTYKTHIGNDIYPSIRLVLPNKDHRKYYMKHTELVSFIIKLYDIPKQSTQSKLLREWKTQFHNLLLVNSDPTLSQLPKKICQVIANRRAVSHKFTKKYTVNEINDTLDQLVKNTKTEDRIKLLKPVFDNLKIDEIRWFLNIILKISNVGYMDRFVFELWNSQTYQLYNICHDLARSFRYFSTNDSIDPKKLIPQVNYPFIPQASHKLVESYAKLCSKMPECYIEEKIDGDRMVLHFDNGHFKFYSRRCRDYSFLFGESFESGSLTKHLKLAFHPNIKKLILDGEIVAYDFERQCILPFGTLRKAAIQEAVRDYTTTDMFAEHNCWPYLLVFDILQVNDKSLVHTPLKQRKKALEKAINEVPHRLEILKYKLCKDPLDIENAVKGVIVDRSEGIMVKNVKSKYHVAKRDNSWIKVKPEYLEQFGENLDLAVIGIIPAIKNSYMCGLYDEEAKVWRSFCTVANGFTNQEFIDLDRLLKDKLLDKCPDNVVFGRRKPKYYLHPEDSVVLEIKARVYDQRTDETYATNTTLRNLYCRGIRMDKPSSECILYQEYEEMRANRNEGLHEAQDPNKKRRSEEDSFKEQSFTGLLKARADLFKGTDFVILSDHLYQLENVRVLSGSLKQVVILFGGTVLSKPTFSPLHQTIVISEKLTPSCKTFILQGLDIVLPDWIFHCIENETIIPLEQQVVLSSKNHIPSNTDEYGDSYCITPRIDFGSYLLLFRVKAEDPDTNLRGLEHELESSQPLLKNLFSGSRFLIIDLNISWQQEILGTQIKQFGGIISHQLQADYIIVPQSIYDMDRTAVLEEIKRLLKQISDDYKQSDRIPNFIMESFFEESVKHNIKVDPQDHKVI